MLFVIHKNVRSKKAIRCRFTPEPLERLRDAYRFNHPTPWQADATRFPARCYSASGSFVGSITIVMHDNLSEMSFLSKQVPGRVGEEETGVPHKGARTMGSAIGPWLVNWLVKQTSTPPPDCPNIGTTAPQSIGVVGGGFIS
jgi:hypothetical protein